MVRLRFRRGSALGCKAEAALVAVDALIVVGIRSGGHTYSHLSILPLDRLVSVLAAVGVFLAVGVLRVVGVHGAVCTWSNVCTHLSMAIR